jgi:S1-C subfamily serine protease
VLAVLVLLAGLVATPATAAPAPSPRTPLDQSALLSQVVPGLVDINTTLSYQGAVGAGTGILLNPDGEVLTNNHVIEGATEITAVSLANSRTYAVDVIGFDRASDIALVRLRGAGSLPTAVLGRMPRGLLLWLLLRAPGGVPSLLPSVAAFGSTTSTR